MAIAHSNEKHRSPESVLLLVREAVDHLGGIREFVQPGQTVMIKPNQAGADLAESGCTADPLVVEALIRMAREAGAAKVQVGESSDGFVDCWSACGRRAVAAVAGWEGAELIDLGRDGAAESGSGSAGRSGAAARSVAGSVARGRRHHCGPEGEDE